MQSRNSGRARRRASSAGSLSGVTVITSRWAEAIRMNSSRISRGTPTISVISGGDAADRRDEVDGLSGRHHLVHELVGDLREPRLEASHQTRTERAHEDAAHLAVARRIEKDHVLEGGSPIDSFPRETSPRFSAGVSPGLPSSLRAHSGNCARTASVGSLASPTAKP